MRICLVPLRIELRQPCLNLQQLTNSLGQIRHQVPDLICLPECTLTGYLYSEDDFTRFAEPIPGPTTDVMAAMARDCRAYLSFGMLESTEQGVYDTALLMDRTGSIMGVHRKIAEKPPFINGDRVISIDMEFGKLSILICGDLFDEKTITQLDPGIRLLIVPMYRCFTGLSPDPTRWDKEERKSYLDAVRRAGVPAVLVNALAISPTDSSFGGAMVVSADGRLLAESPHGTDTALVYIST